MNILCPTDFSNTSVAACRWAVGLLNNMGGGRLELLHCINTVSRSAIFLKMDDIYRQRAEEDLKALLADLEQLTDKVELVAHVVIIDPKSFVPEYATRKEFDFVVTGTKGLTALKDMTVGSVTAHLMDRCMVPVLAIPEDVTYAPIKHIVLGVDDKKITDSALAPLTKLRQRNDAALQVVHTTLDDDLSVPYDPYLSLPLKAGSFEFATIPQKVSVAATLTDFAVRQEAQLLVMVHRQRTWLERLFNNSIVKSELFNIQTPLLILPA